MPAATWDAFAQLRTWTGLSTGVLLHEAVRLELEHEDALDNIDIGLVSA